MESRNVILINTENTTNDDMKMIGVDDDFLDELWQKLSFPSDMRMRELTDDEIIGNPKKYIVNYREKSEDKTIPYQIEFFEKYFSLERDIEAPLLKKIVDAYDENDELKYNVIAYVKREDSKQLEVSIFELKDDTKLKNRIFAFYNTKAKQVKITKNNKILNIPFDKNKCLASFYVRKEDDGTYTYTVKVFNAIMFDSIFKVKYMQEKYAKNVIAKFNDKYTLTQDECKVKFIGESDNTEETLKEIEEIAIKNDAIRNFFANYTDNPKRKIKSITIERLKEVLDELCDFAINRADSQFKKDDIPEINESNEIIVSQRTLPIFTALLNNSVIERLLDKNIIIPSCYFISA